MAAAAARGGAGGSGDGRGGRGGRRSGAAARRARPGRRRAAARAAARRGRAARRSSTPTSCSRASTPTARPTPRSARPASSRSISAPAPGRRPRRAVGDREGRAGSPAPVRRPQEHRRAAPTADRVVVAVDAPTARSTRRSARWASTRSNIANLSDSARNGIVQTDGKIVSVGYTSQPTGVGTQTREPDRARAPQRRRPPRPAVQAAPLVQLARRWRGGAGGAAGAAAPAPGTYDTTFGVGGIVNSNPFSSHRPDDDVGHGRGLRRRAAVDRRLRHDRLRPPRALRPGQRGLLPLVGGRRVRHHLGRRTASSRRT